MIIKVRCFSSGLASCSFFLRAPQSQISGAGAAAASSLWVNMLVTLWVSRSVGRFLQDHRSERQRDRRFLSFLAAASGLRRDLCRGQHNQNAPVMFAFLPCSSVIQAPPPYTSSPPTRASFAHKKKRTKLFFFFPFLFWCNTDAHRVTKWHFSTKIFLFFFKSCCFGLLHNPFGCCHTHAVLRRRYIFYLIEREGSTVCQGATRS